jgi:TPR repeat protein
MKGKKLYQEAQATKLMMYSSALSGQERDTYYELYFMLIRQAAYRGHTDAIYDYAQQYENIGFLGVPNPHYAPPKCIYWYKRLARKAMPRLTITFQDFMRPAKGASRICH